MGRSVRSQLVVLGTGVSPESRPAHVEPDSDASSVDSDGGSAHKLCDDDKVKGWKGLSATGKEGGRGVCLPGCMLLPPLLFFPLPPWYPMRPYGYAEPHRSNASLPSPN